MAVSKYDALAIVRSLARSHAQRRPQNERNSLNRCDRLFTFRAKAARDRRAQISASLAAISNALEMRRDDMCGEKLAGERDDEMICARAL